MRNADLASVLLVVALAVGGCSTMRDGSKQSVMVGTRTIEVNPDGFNASAFIRPDPYNANVWISDDGFITVDQDPIRRKSTDTQVLLVWRLDANPSYYIFPDDTAIVLTGTVAYPLPADLGCGVVRPKMKVFYCSYTRERPSKWYYSVRVRNDQAGTEFPMLDPWIHNQ